ncbi:MAG: ATP-binding protein [Deltaproteobacteria bacterium]|nr:ATP-binding protein [Deltaproteobacteria bacterium]
MTKIPNPTIENGKDEELIMKFDPNTIQHLGIQMYSTLPPVIVELVANSYDAEANEVKIYLYDNREESSSFLVGRSVDTRL